LDEFFRNLQKLPENAQNQMKLKYPYLGLNKKPHFVIFSFFFFSIIKIKLKNNSINEMDKQIGSTSNSKPKSCSS